MPPALLIIDLQVDFVSPNGLLKKKHILLDPILDHLIPVCSAFKDNKYPIVTIRSEYSPANHPEHKKPTQALERPDDEEFQDIPGNDERLSGTHTGSRPFCAPGSAGADFPDAVRDLVERFADTTITKKWYSAFTDTELHQWLQDNGVGNGPLYFAGVTTNNCVLATLTDAFFHRYQVRPIRECVAGINPSLENEALKKIERYYGNVVQAKSILADLWSNVVAKDGTTEMTAPIVSPARTLYWVSGSIPSWRVMLCLSHKGLPYTRKRLHVMSTPKETREREFAAINPRCKTPVLIDEDGTTVMESMAILQYLETYYGSETGTGMLPDPKDKERYRTTLQRFHESENLHNVFEDIELLFWPKWDQSPARERILEAYEKTLEELKFWESYLAVSVFVAGDEFSLADCAFYPNLGYLIHRGLDLDREGFKALKRYSDLVKDMDCARDALPVKYETVGKNLFLRVYELVKKEKEARLDATRKAPMN
jgi:glutathione S-transferase/nicotinamidase-related amidase